MFFAALFTTTKKQKQPKCSSTNEWIKKMLKNMYFFLIYMYTHIQVYGHYAAIKMDKICPLVTT